MSADFDTSELRTFTADLRAVPEWATRHAIPIVKRGAQNIKDEIAGNFKSSTHFKQLASSVTYDIHTGSFAGDGVIEAEIGPRHGGGEPGNLANVAIFGTSRGGGTVPDPQIALEREIPKFEAALADLMKDVL